MLPSDSVSVTIDGLLKSMSPSCAPHHPPSGCRKWWARAPAALNPAALRPLGTPSNTKLLAGAALVAVAALPAAGGRIRAEQWPAQRLARARSRGARYSRVRRPA